MSKTKLHLRLDKWIENANLSEDGGVKTNIYGHKSKDSSLKSYYDLSIPVGQMENYFTITLDPGSYTIECILPSGEIVTKDVKITSGEDKYISIQSSYSPREYLSFQHYYGNVARQQVKKYESDIQPTNINKVLKKEFMIKSRSLENFDTKEFLSVTLGSKTNDVWKNTIDKNMHQSRGLNDEIDETVSMIDDILLDGMIEISGGTYADSNLTGKNIWFTLLQLIGKEGQDELYNLMEASYNAKNKIDDNYSFQWIDPYISTDVNIYELKEKNEPPIRNFLLWTPSGAELFSIPAWWRDSRFYEYVPIEIMVDISSYESDFRSSIAVKDQTLSSAIAYLLAGSLPTAGKFIQKQAQDMLYAKIKNPYSAVLGAYILMETKYDEPNISWKNWVTNLYNWFDWMPDSGILKAWLHIEKKEWDEAKTLLVEATSKGLPLYTFALKKLQEGLKLFDEDEDVKAIIKVVRKISWRSNPQQLFTVIRLGLPPTTMKS